MKIEIDSEVVTGAILIALGAIFIFKPELVGIIIGLFLIIMGVNSLTKYNYRGKSNGWRKKA